MRAVVIDDHAPFCDAARRMLSAAGLEVVGSAGDLAGARSLIETVDPDVVLLDVQLPDGNGFELAKELMPTATTVLMTSSRPDRRPARGARPRSRVPQRR